MEPISLFVSLLAGIIAGNILSAAMKQDSINLIWRSLVGGIGGVLGAFAFALLNGEGTISGPLVELYTGAFGGAILTAIAGAIVAPVFTNKR